MKYLVIQGKFLAHVSARRTRPAEPQDDLWANNIREREGGLLMNFKHAHSLLTEKEHPLPVRRLFTRQFLPTSVNESELARDEKYFDRCRLEFR